MYSFAINVCFILPYPIFYLRYHILGYFPSERLETARLIETFSTFTLESSNKLEFVSYHTYITIEQIFIIFISFVELE